MFVWFFDPNSIVKILIELEAVDPMAKGSGGSSHRRAQKARQQSKSTSQADENSGTTCHLQKPDHTRAAHLNPQDESDAAQQINDKCEPELDRERGMMPQDTEEKNSGVDFEIPKERVMMNKHTITQEPPEEHGREQEANVQSLQEENEALKNEIESIQQTLQESHQAFAHQIVQLSVSHDQENEAARKALLDKLETTQELLSTSQDRVRILECQVKEQEETISTLSSSNNKGLAQMVSLQNQITVRFLQGDRKGLSLLCKTILANAPEPRTESLAHIAKELGYTESSDYVRINSYVTNISSRFWKRYE